MQNTTVNPDEKVNNLICWTPFYIRKLQIFKMVRVISWK